MWILVLPCGFGSSIFLFMFSPPLFAFFGLGVCMFGCCKCRRFRIVIFGRSSLWDMLLLSMCVLFLSCGGTLLLHARSYL